jgi:hypothetical protein
VHGTATCACRICAERRRATALAYRVKMILEDRAAGRRTIRGAAWALCRYFRRKESLSCARGLHLDPDREGSGRPNRALDDPGRIFDAHVAYAIKLAQDDAARGLAGPERDKRREQLYVWLEQHFGAGRACSWIAEDAGVGEGLMKGRLERARRIVHRRLREMRLLEDDERGEG